MSRKRLTEAVIRQLQQRGYRFLRVLGRGGFADVIAVLTPDNTEQAVKIVRKKKVWMIEDEYWPTLNHTSLLQVNYVMEIEDLNAKLYFMPILPNTLSDVIKSKEFRKDLKSYNRVKKWLNQVLSGIEYLHNRGLCHLDLKADNILIDSEDNALVADFSGLNFTKFPINRLIAPHVYRPPECFTPKECSNIKGKSYDLWSFGVLTLNVLTGRGHYYLKKKRGIAGNDARCPKLFSLLNKALKETKFEKYIRKSFPNCNLSENDVSLARHFIQFVMKVRPEDRPGALKAKKHLFLKIFSNPFTKEYYDSLQGMSGRFNPFHKDPEVLDLQSQGDIGIFNSLIEPEQNKVFPKRKNVGKDVKKWFVRNINKVFKQTF